MAPKVSKKGGESKPGLVITLVFFILLSIGLGISTYTGFAVDDTKDKKIKDLTADMAKMTKNRDWHKFQALQFQAYMGHLSKPDDLQELKLLRDKFDQGVEKEWDADRPAMSQLIGNIEKKQVMEWDRDKNPAVLSSKIPYEERLVAAQKEYETEHAKVAGLRAEKDKAEDRAKKAEDLAKTAQANYDGALVKVNKDSGTEKTDLIKAKDDMQKEVVRLGGEVEKQMAKAADEKKQLLAAYDKKSTEMADLKKQLQQKLDELAAVKLKGTDAPKDWRTDWKIVRIDREGTTAYINLGSADLVREQLTFSVHGLDLNRKPVMTSKGSIEVTNVLSDHLSQVRITGVRDTQRDPVMQGDVLFNPGWNPAIKKHVAITGLVDLTGEGRDNLAELKRNLERQNIVVDSWLERRGREEFVVKGPGMTVQTDFLLVGDGQEYLSDSSANVKFLTALEEKVKKAKEDAVLNGVQVKGLRKYMEEIGYRMPRVVTDRPYRPAFPTSDADKKPEDKKPEDKPMMDDKPMADDKKPEDKKPEDKKPEDKKPEDKKPEDKNM